MPLFASGIKRNFRDALRSRLTCCSDTSLGLIVIMRRRCLPRKDRGRESMKSRSTSVIVAALAAMISASPAQAGDLKQVTENINSW